MKSWMKNSTNLLVVVGGTSMYALVPIYMFRYSYCDEVLALEPAKKVANHSRMAVIGFSI